MSNKVLVAKVRSFFEHALYAIFKTRQIITHISTAPFHTTSTHLTFMHHASSIQDRRFATLQRTLLIYLINKYVSLSDISLTVHH